MAGKLILSFHDQVLGEYALNKETVTIGRKAQNDIQIDNLAVSGEHARVLTILNDSFLEDLHSTNGTVVNGQRITKHPLKHGDVIEIVKHKLKYVNEEGAAAEEDFEKTMVFRPGALGAEPEVMSAAQAAKQMGVAPKAVAAPPPPPPAAARLRPAALRVANGPNQGKELVLTKPLTSLGKPGVQVATISKQAQGYLFSHVEGKHPPRINGEPVGPQGHLLADHDLIDLDGIQVEFLFKQ